MPGRVLSGVGQVGGHEQQNREQEGGDPEAGRVGVAELRVHGAADAGYSPGDGVLDVAAGLELLGQADEEEEEQPPETIGGDGGTV